MSGLMKDFLGMSFGTRGRTHASELAKPRPPTPGAFAAFKMHGGPYDSKAFGTHTPACSVWAGSRSSLLALDAYGRHAWCRPRARRTSS
jgi:hypothetical protein